MRDVLKALYEFFSGFGAAAYAENHVPVGAETPYVTYEAVNPDYATSQRARAWVWYKSGGREAALAVCEAMLEAIGERGAWLGAAYVMPGGSAKEKAEVGERMGCFEVPVIIIGN